MIHSSPDQGLSRKLTEKAGNSGKKIHRNKNFDDLENIKDLTKQYFKAKQHTYETCPKIFSPPLQLLFLLSVQVLLVCLCTPTLKYQIKSTLTINL